MKSIKTSATTAMVSLGSLPTSPVAGDILVYDGSSFIPVTPTPEMGAPPDPPVIVKENGMWVVRLPVMPMDDVDAFIGANNMIAVRRGREVIVHAFEDATLIRLKYCAG